MLLASGQKLSKACRRCATLRRGISLLTVTVIIPCFNASQYVGDAINSILCQSYGSLDVLIIDDGSTDGTAEILSRLASQDRRLRIIRQENAGIGKTRNVGLSNVRGEYLTFVDADDQLHPQCIEALKDKSDATHSDITMAGRIRFRGKPKWDNSPALTDYPDHFTPSEHQAVFKRVEIHGKLFRTSFLKRHRITFQELRSHEDHGFSILANLKAQNISVVRRHLYYYRRDHASSLTRRRLRKGTLLGRMSQIETSIALSRDGDGTSVANLRRVHYKQFEKKLIYHVAALQNDCDSAAVNEAWPLLSQFSQMYEPVIRSRCSPQVVSIYEALWSNDEVSLQRALYEHRQLSQ